MVHSIKSINWRVIGLLSLLLIFIFCVFSPVLRAGFINWDDDRYLTENPQIRDISLHHFSKPFLFPQSANYYQPLTFLTYSLEYKFFGLNPFIYHLDNILLHLLNVLLVFQLACYLSAGSIGVAFLTAILFGFHPLRVESVAWIAERNDVLFSFFYLSGLLSYISFVLSRFQKNQYFVLTVFLFICAVLSKPQAVSFPLLLCAMDFYFKRKLGWKVIKEKIPFFLIALLFLLINMLFLKPAIDGNVYNSYSGIEKFVLANFALLMLFFKALLPIHLSLIYPFPEINKIGFMPAIVWVSPIVVMGILAGGLYYFKKSEIFIFTSSFFFITILLPLINMNYGFFLNDRYAYLPHVGLFWGLSMILLKWIGEAEKNIYKSTKVILLTIYVLFLCGATYQRSMIWQNSTVLWSDVIKKFPNVALAYSKRGILESESGYHKEAIDDFDKAIDLNPQEFSFYNNRGYARLRAKQYAQAIEDFTKTISLKQGYLLAYRNRAQSYYNLGQYEQALGDVNVVNQLGPQDASNHYYLSIIYFHLGNYDKALNEAKKAKNLGFPLKSSYLNHLFSLIS